MLIVTSVCVITVLTFEIVKVKKIFVDVVRLDEFPFFELTSISVQACSIKYLIFIKAQIRTKFGHFQLYERFSVQKIPPKKKRCFLPYTNAVFCLNIVLSVLKSIF